MPTPVLHWSETEAARQYADAVQKTGYLFKQIASGSGSIVRYLLATSLIRA